MKKTASNTDDDYEMPAEYDLASMKGGVRGKYVKRCEEGSNVVFLAPDLVKYFPDSESVNAALHSLVQIAVAGLAKPPQNARNS